MHIAVSAPFNLHGGGLIHLKHLVHAWCCSLSSEHSVTLFLRQASVPLLQIPEDHRFRLFPIENNGMSLVGKLAWEQATLPRLLRDANADVVFCPGNLVPLSSPVPSVVAFRNAGPFCRGMDLRTLGLHDWSFFRVLGPLMRLSARAADRVIFISNYFRDLFVSKFHFPPNRADVIYHGRDAFTGAKPSHDLLRQLGVRPPYCLSVSHLYPYKNFPALIRGYALAKKTLQKFDLRLVLAGKPNKPEYLEYLKTIVRAEGLQDWIIFTGPVPHDGIGPLMAGCDFFVFQTICENCPNTVIEALASGLPVACSNAGVMPEIAGNAAVYFDPAKPAEIGLRLQELASDLSLRARLRELALIEARRFPTWSEVGQLTVQSLQRAVAGR